MKSDARRLTRILREMPRLRVICLYGDDDEGIRDCARRLVTAEAGSADDPFRVSECDGDQREAIESALGSPALSGGRAVVWVRHATERLLPLVAASLAGTALAGTALAGTALAGAAGALMVLEYGASTGRSRLRTQVEQSEHGCVIACYAQAGATRDAIRAILDGWDVTASEEVVGLLAAQAEAMQCPGQRAGLVAALYAGERGRLDMTDACELGGASSAGGVDSGLNEGLCGDGAALDGAVAAALDESAAISVLRSALLHLQRLRAVAVQVADGRTVAEAARTVRPPVSFRQERSTGLALRNWNAEQLAAAARVVWEAERSSKAAGVPQEAVCREVLAGLARIGLARIGLARIGLTRTGAARAAVRRD